MCVFARVDWVSWPCSTAPSLLLTITTHHLLLHHLLLHHSLLHHSLLNHIPLNHLLRIDPARSTDESTLPVSRATPALPLIITTHHHHSSLITSTSFHSTITTNHFTHPSLDTTLHSTITTHHSRLLEKRVEAVRLEKHEVAHRDCAE